MAIRTLLPPVDQDTLNEAYAVAYAAFREGDPEVRKVLEEEALRLWAAAHQARRNAMYRCGCLVADDE